jgi:ParB-like chromosome segregation protein Spo0J
MPKVGKIAKLNSIDFTTVEINSLVPAPYNPRLIGVKQLRELRNTLSLGIIEPIVVNKRNNNIVGGHQRWQSLKELGATTVEIVYVDLEEREEVELNIELNKIEGYTDDVKLKRFFIKNDIVDTKQKVEAVDPSFDFSFIDVKEKKTEKKSSAGEINDQYYIQVKKNFKLFQQKLDSLGVKYEIKNG